MRPRRLTPIGRALAAALAALLITLPAAAQSAPSAKGDPAAVVHALYRDHFAHEQRWSDTVKRHREAFAPSLLALLDEDERRQAAEPNEVVGIDFDPMVNSQEAATGHEVTGTALEGAEAVVTVKVALGAETQLVRVRLASVDGVWRVTNLVYEDGDLVGILKELQ